MTSREGDLDITTLRNATMKQLGFFNKLCNATERVKVFANLFLDRKPKFE